MHSTYYRSVRWAFFLILVFLPGSFSSAQVIISEVMYDLAEGSDAGREWIEVENIGSAPVDLSTWKLNEGETNHGLIVSQGEAVLPPNAFAIISDTPAKFLIDNPGFSGRIFDSSFSLSNTGETLILKKQNEDKTFSDADTFSYTSELGANGTGQTLQKVSGSWLLGNPTSGVANVSSPAPAQTNTGNTSGTEEQTGALTPTPSPSGSSGSVEQTIFPDAGSDKTVVAGASAVFTGVALGSKKEPLLNARYLWNFGDGTTAEGKSVAHTYAQTGQYLVYLEVSSADRSNIDRAVVTVIDAPLTVSNFVSGISGFIEIQNSANLELDISHWQITDGRTTFIIPKNTFVLAKKPIRFSNEITRLSQGNSLRFLYPSGLPVRMQAISSTPAATVSKSATVESVAKPSSDTVSYREPTNEVAAVAHAFSNTEEPSHSNSKWYGVLLLLVLFSIGGVLYIRIRSRMASQPQEVEKGSGFEIIEEEE